MGFKFLRRGFGYLRNDNIVLHQHKTIYFPIPKVACTSIKKFLWDLLDLIPPDPDNPMALIHKRDYPFVRKNVIHKRYRDYFRFCFVRNPWDRLLSCYRNKIKPDKFYNDQWYENGVAEPFLRYGDTFKGGMSFAEFVEAVNGIPDRDADNHFRSQHDFITDKRGNLLVDYVGKFENLKDDFHYVCNRMGATNVALPHLMKGAHSFFKDYYNDHTMNIVRERYSKDIELFEYDF